MRRREQPVLQIATIRDTNEGNASDTMHACFQIAGCKCSEGVLSAPVALVTGLPSSGFCATVGRTRMLSSVKLVRMPPCFSQPLAAGFVVRAYAANPIPARVQCLKSRRSVTSPSVSAVSGTMATVIVDATVVRMNHDRFRAGLRFLFFAPDATSGTWRQDAVVLGRKADTTPPRKGPRDLSRNVFVISTRKLKRNSLPTRRFLTCLRMRRAMIWSFYSKRANDVLDIFKSRTLQGKQRC